jgi:uncharacterized membrane protein YcgQ (UPF0703/DUF1980 family)
MNKERKMSKSYLLAIGLLLAISGYTQAQVISSDFQKNCAQEQVQEQEQEHKDIKKKVLTEEDFKPYCSCLAQYISRSANNKQINELVMNPKAKPEWLKAIELKAMKTCIADPKMST